MYLNKLEAYNKRTKKKTEIKNLEIGDVDIFKLDIVRYLQGYDRRIEINYTIEWKDNSK
jgi:hypothetical protein